jgi:hypothetical protein
MYMFNLHMLIWLVYSLYSIDCNLDLWVVLKRDGSNIPLTLNRLGLPLLPPRNLA